MCEIGKKNCKKIERTRENEEDLVRMRAIMSNDMNWC